MRTSLFRVLSAAIGSALATKLYPYFVELSITSGFALALSTSLAVLAYKILEWLLVDMPISFSLTRPLSDPKSRIEGYWIQIKRSAELRPYAITNIVYNKSESDYVVTGASYDASGYVGASWRSTRCIIDLRNDRVVYFFSGHMHDHDKGPVFEGVTFMNLETDRRGKYKRGTGYFIDTFSKRADFALTRMSKRDIARLIGKKDISTYDDCKMLIEKFHAERSGPIFTRDEHSALTAA